MTDPLVAPTLHDVARIAGVSLATASRVLNGSQRNVAESYRVKVERVAEELGYTANLSAQAIARGTSPTIALLVADIADPYFGLVASGVVRGADERGLVVNIAITERDPDREKHVLRALRGQRPRGVIVAASRREDDGEGLREELAVFGSLGGRTVTLGIGGDRTVMIDNTGGARELGAAMGELGYRRAIVLGAMAGVATSDHRIAGFTEGFAAAGGVVERVYPGSFQREAGVSAMRAALSDGIDSGVLVFAISDVVAIGAMSVLREDGREVGSDVAICGFDDIPASADVTPRLTTVHIPLSDVGYQAFRAVVDDDWQQEPVALRVVVRESTPRVS